MLSSQACVSPDAIIAPDAVIGPFVVIESGVTVGAGCVLESNCMLRTGTKLGARVHVHPHVVIGGLPQDYSFDPKLDTGVTIGDDTVLREGVTVNRATKTGTDTRVGSGCMLMACSHVAHDCVVGDRVTIANAALLGGHAQVGDSAFISGGVALHQFNRVGCGAMVSSNAVITQDVPPYSIAAERNELIGFNLVGMRRQGLSAEAVSELKRAWRAIYDPRSTDVVATAKHAIESGDYATKEAAVFLRFFAEPGKRPGVIRPRSVQ